jgi:hypothetical protein
MEPLPEVEAREERHDQVAVTEELLDVDDFSFASLDSAPPAARVETSSSASDAGAELEETSSDDDDYSTVPAVDARASTSDSDEADRADDAMGFVPFSDLGPQVPESGAENVDGLETYSFESPDGPVAEVSEDVVSFYLEPTNTAPEAAESADQAEGFESVETEFAAKASPVAETETLHQTEESVDHVGQTDSFESHDEAGGAESAEPRGSTPAASMATPVASQTAAPTPTPARSTPVTARGIVASAPDLGTPTDSESDAFATETMAKLYLSQGHFESALGIYRTLSAKQPDDESLRRQIEEIEDRVQRRRREPTPPTPIETSPMDSAPSDDENEFAEPTSRAGVPTMRDFLLGIIRRGAPSAAPTAAGAPNGGTIDALFDEGDALGDDLVAADTLAQAFAPETERDPLVGRPAREASNELSLDRVFRQPTPAHAGEASTGGFSFDQFFAGERTEDSEADDTGKPADDDDIEQFNAWLNGLKKS